MRRALAALALAAASLALFAAVPVPARADAPADCSGGTVVHFGDSFVDAGLRQALGPRFAAEHTRYIVASKTSSWLSSWAGSVKLNELYWGWRPSLFIVTLGANELRADPAPRAALVRQIVREMHGTPCVWISIPLWPGMPPDLNDMIRRESAPCRFFDSTVVESKIPRQAFDGAHPTMEGGAIWADAFWRWLDSERDRTGGGKGPWALKPRAGEDGG
jgi:lysophospholipase L1-like esterase